MKQIGKKIENLSEEIENVKKNEIENLKENHNKWKKNLIGWAQQ